MTIRQDRPCEKCNRVECPTLTAPWEQPCSHGRPWLSECEECYQRNIRALDVWSADCRAHRVDWRAECLSARATVAEQGAVLTAASMALIDCGAIVGSISYADAIRQVAADRDRAIARAEAAEADNAILLPLLVEAERWVVHGDDASMARAVHHAKWSRARAALTKEDSDDQA